MDHEKNLNGLALSISEPTSPTGQLAILLPGFGDSKDYAALVYFRQELAARGILAVAFDAPGIWKSAGLGATSYTMTNTLKGVEKIITHFRSETEIKQIILLGHSRGAQMAILAAAANPEINAVIAIAPPVWPPKIGNWINGFRETTRDLPADPEKKIILRIDKAFIEDDKKYDVLKEVKNLTAPLLLIVGTADNEVLPTDVRKIYEAANKPKEYIELPDIGHDYRHYPDKIKKINAEIINFLKKYKFIGEI